jgi:hypothetical protein
VDEDVAGDVRGIRRSRLAGGAERPLRDTSVLRPGEHRSPVLELVDVLGRFVAEHLDRVLVAEVVGTLDRIERMLLRAVVGGVAERRVDPTFGRARVAANWVDLGDERNVRTRVVSLDGCAHTGATGADDEDVVLGFHYFGRYRIDLDGGVRLEARRGRCCRRRRTSRSCP